VVEIGECTRARKLCERLLGSAGSLGLYGEELDAATGRHLGNFPQALTHLALVNAVLHVIEAEQTRSEFDTGSAASASWWEAAGRDERPGTKPV
jgi:alpha,alpha-trehalase